MPSPMPATETTFEHEAVMYDGDGAFLEATLPFIRQGLEAGDALLVVVSADKIGRLRAALGEDADRARFADMQQVGANPARIIPRWQEFVAEHEGRRLRGIGEPITSGRSAAELVECHRHESLLNVAFAQTPAFRLLCPYDTAGLAPEVVAEARRTHPLVCEAGSRRPSQSFAGLDAARAPLALPLPEPDAPISALDFDLGSLAAVRTPVADAARATGMERGRRSDLLLAVSEVAANSVRHGGGQGRVRVWEDGVALVCEVCDTGSIADPLAGRRRPAPGQPGGYGVWGGNEPGGLVQGRSFGTGGGVRLHQRIAGAGPPAAGWGPAPSPPP